MLHRLGSVDLGVGIVAIRNAQSGRTVGVGLRVHGHITNYKGPSIKDVRSQGVKGFVQCGHFADSGGSSDADVRTFWCKKFGIFRNLWCVRTDKGVEPVRTFCRQGGGVNFLRFCADVFYGRPLKINPRLTML